MPTVSNFRLPNPESAPNKVTIGLCSHRPEMIPYISEWMFGHDAIFLEEPSAMKFDQMLSGEIAVSDYLLPLDVEFPEFSIQMCDLLKALKIEGKAIIQIEPFLEILLDIHNFLSDGHSPGDIKKESIQYPVYLAEKKATGALLNYYKAATSGDFNQTVESVKQFARLDAARFRLRDSLRYQELIRVVKKYPSAFIEAGEMHYPLYQMLRKGLAGIRRVKPVFIYRQAREGLGETGPVYGPGDRLTLIYIYHPDIHRPDIEDLLAARSLIHAKIVVKEEFRHDLDRMPHLGNELYCNRIVNGLSIEDCERLFGIIRGTDTRMANHLIADYLDGR